MSALSPTELDALSRTQALKQHRERWNSGPAPHSEATRALAEKGVAVAYGAVGLLSPERIVWCRSPIEIERSRRANWHAWLPGECVKHRIVDCVIHAVGQNVWRALPTGLDWGVFRAVSRPADQPAAVRAVAAVVSAATQDVPWPLRTILARAVRRLKWDDVAPYVPFDVASWGETEFRQLLGTYEYLDTWVGPLRETVPLRGLWSIALNAGWVVAHERVCWLSERCLDLGIDAQGRLHSATGPALRFADGWTYYAWKGIPVPDWFIEDAASITRARISRMHDPVLRRCMIEIMTPERYVATGGAACVATDGAGRLWQCRWGLDTWNVVEVVNGTAEPDGTKKKYYLQVPPGIRTPTEAVAWTYGINAERYGQLKLRT
jgi:hypothetical protein